MSTPFCESKRAGIDSSLLQALFPVDLVEIGLCNKKSVLCVAKESSKVFIAFKLLQDVHRNNVHGKITIIVTGNNTGFFLEKFIQAIELQTSMKYMVFTDAACSRVNQDINIDDTDIFVTNPDHLSYLIKSETITWSNINLLIINDCHLVTNASHPLCDIMDSVKSHDHVNGPIIVGLTSGLPLTSPSHIESVLKEVESVFECSCSVSSDLVALNRYGEQPQDKVIVYSMECGIDEMTDFVSSKIKSLLQYLAEVSQNDENRLSKSTVTNLGSLFKIHYEIFMRFGADAATYNGRTLLREINKMEKRTTNDADLGVICHCKDQLNVILKMYNELQHSELTEPVSKIISSLWIVKCNDVEVTSNTETNTSALLAVDKEKTPFLNYIEKCKNNNGNKVSISVILCNTDQEAASLNFLLNKLAKQSPKLACIKSAYLSSSNVRQSDLSADSEEFDCQAVLQLVNEGQVNVLILSRDVENEIYISSCKQLLRFGIPQDYLSYIKAKEIPREADAEVIFMETSGNWEENENQSYKIFKELESILTKNCEPCKCALKDDAFWEELSSNIESNIEDGHSIETKFAVAVINRYCQSFPKDGFSSPFPCCRTEVIDDDDDVHVVTTLYLPCHSPIYWPFQGLKDIPKEQATPERIAKARSESCAAAAVLACKALQETRELEKQVGKLSVDSFSYHKSDEQCSAEVADGDNGKEGSSKRRRVYERKFPSILMNNLCVAETTAYLYHISIKASQANPLGVDLTQNYVSSNMLGIISRNRLPEIPDLIIYHKATELTVSITECANTVTLTTEELHLIQHFHRYVHTDIMCINGESSEECFKYEPATQTYGFYVVAIDAQNREHKSEEAKEIVQSCSDELSLQSLKISESMKNFVKDVNLQAGGNDVEKDDFCGCEPKWLSRDDEARCNLHATTCDVTSSCVRDHNVFPPTPTLEFLKHVNQEFGSLSSPVDPIPQKHNDFEGFRGRIVTAVYMARPMRYIVTDILYDMSPSSEFPDLEVAATFSDYYKQRYDINIHVDQPLLEVRCLSKMINSLVSKYRDSKGRDRTLPTKNSKRQKKSQIFLIPELCSIHPIPTLLWRDILHVPSILFRLEAILLAEELRQVIAANTGVGTIEWPHGVKLPLVTMGEAVGESDDLPSSLAGGSEDSNEIVDSSGRQQQKVEKTLESPNPKGLKESTESKDSGEKQYHSSDALGTTLEALKLPFSCDSKQSQGFEPEQLENCKENNANASESLVKDGVRGSTVSSKQFRASKIYVRQPSSTLILKALTCSGAVDVFNHDRLEMYGDAFIKFAVSLKMYCESPLLNVGKLSFYRGLHVSNRQLFYLGRVLNIPSYIFNITFQPLVTWCPHGFKMVKLNSSQDYRLKLNPGDQELDISDTEDERCEEEISEVSSPEPTSSVQIEGHIHLVASDKNVADTIEAIVGAYLVICGVKGALEVMKWIGFDVEDNVVSQALLFSVDQMCQRAVTNHDQFQDPESGSVCHLESEFQDVEATIGYSFNNKVLLLQAFTHISYPRDLNHVHTCYEQLEFLGDAVLDYLVTRHFYFTHRNMSPGALTDLRSAVVNSYSFAFLSVQHGFHKHLRSLSPAVFRVTNRFIAMQKDAVKKKTMANPDQIFSSVFVPPDEDENNEGVEVPKVLADLFESVIGAVFIDSGMDVEKTWTVVFKLLKTTFDHYADNPPTSPIRQLKEMLQNDVSFMYGDRTITGRYSCSVTVKGYGKFKGTGRSLKIARSTAAQRALAHIASKKESEGRK